MHSFTEQEIEELKFAANRAESILERHAIAERRIAEDDLDKVEPSKERRYIQHR